MYEMLYNSDVLVHSVLKIRFSVKQSTRNYVCNLKYKNAVNQCNICIFAICEFTARIISVVSIIKSKNIVCINCRNQISPLANTSKFVCLSSSQ